eukprot:scaffold1158_cov98-Skeletonema_dohrnii-CCMP3373.AAC.2
MTMTGLLKIAGMGDARFCVCLGVGRYFPQVGGRRRGLRPLSKGLSRTRESLSRLSLNQPFQTAGGRLLINTSIVPQ